MSAVMSTLGTMVLMFVLPCAIILYFVLQCYADYLKRSDDNALEAFRVQAQERRLMLQGQRERGNNTNAQHSSTTTGEDNLRNIQKLTEVFQFHTVGTHDETSSIHQKAKKKKEKKKKPTKCGGDQKSTKKNAMNKTKTASTEEPQGFKREDCDDSDLELSIRSNTAGLSHHQSSCQTINIFRERLMGGGTISSVAANKKNPPPGPPMDDEKTPKEDEDCCCICLDGYSEGDIICTPKLGDCGHVFHKECMFEWIKQDHDCCPLCRVVLIK